jgi:imidazolonepropionase-like amidohydrolase
MVALSAPVAGFAQEAAVLRLEGAWIEPVHRPGFDDGVVVIGERGTLLAVGTRDEVGPPVGTEERVDLSGLQLYPGLIAATSSLGLTEIAAVRASNDVGEIGDHNARIRAYRSVNPDSELIPVARSNGITHALVVPGGSLVRGQSGLMRLDGWSWEDRLEQGPVALHVQWPSMGLDRHGEDAEPIDDQVRGRREKLAELDRYLDVVRAYRQARGVEPARKTRPQERDLELEAWIPVLDRRMPVVVHANEKRQIHEAVEWARRNELRLILAGGRDAYLLAEELAEAEIPVILEQVMGRPAYDWEPYDLGYRRAALLHEAGVPLAISVGAGPWADSIVRNLPFHAGMAHSFGLPREAALQSITLAPARVLGVGDRMGSLEVGKRAHLIATSGDVLDIRSQVRRMWIGGREVDLQNRQTRLSERYRRRPKPAASDR